MKYLWLLDPAHGPEVPGKRSPDGKLIEWKWSRAFIMELAQTAMKAGLKIGVMAAAANNEPGLSARVKYYNECHSTCPKIMVSIHCNAAGNGTAWAKARGFEIWTSKGQTKSDRIADVFAKQLLKTFPTVPHRWDKTDGDLDKESNFTVLMGSNYSAILVENLFQDNQEDVALLLDHGFNDMLVKTYVAAMLEVEAKV